MNLGSRLGAFAFLMLLGLVECGGSDDARPTGAAGASGAAGSGSGGTAGKTGTAGTAGIGRQDDMGGAAGAPEEPSSACLAPTAEDYEPIWMPPRALPGACTPEQISQKYAYCANGSAQYDATACRAFDVDPDNSACLGCLFSALGDEASGAIIVFPGDRWLANIGACNALLDGDTTDTGCGARTQAASICRYGACLDACADSPPAEDWAACETAARMACNAYVKETACASLPRYARCQYRSFEEYFLGIGDIFCGAGPDGAGSAGGAGVGGAGAGGGASIAGGEGGVAGSR